VRASKTKTITGDSNAAAARLGDIVVVALPATGLGATLPEAREGVAARW
jgi:predicted dinucleotide-binding enzyme